MEHSRTRACLCWVVATMIGLVIIVISQSVQAAFQRPITTAAYSARRRTSHVLAPSSITSAQQLPFLPLMQQESAASEAASTSRFSTDDMNADNDIWTEEQVTDFASRQGVLVSLSTLGPAYRAVARSKRNTTQILGYVEGFLRPSSNVLHLDKMEVFHKVVKQAQQQEQSNDNDDDQLETPIRSSSSSINGGTVFGIGLLLGYLCVLHGRDNAKKVAEFLAIDDEEHQHKRLVRYYQRMGFKVIKYVGDDFADIPDRMVWGGCGTLMREDIDTILKSTSRLLRYADRQQGETVIK